MKPGDRVESWETGTVLPDTPAEPGCVWVSWDAGFTPDGGVWGGAKTMVRADELRPAHQPDPPAAQIEAARKRVKQDAERGLQSSAWVRNLAAGRPPQEEGRSVHLPDPPSLEHVTEILWPPGAQEGDG